MSIYTNEMKFLFLKYCECNTKWLVDYRIKTKNVKIHVQFYSEFLYVLVHEHLEDNQPKDSF